MDIEVVKKLIRRYSAGHAVFVRRAETAQRYYRNEPDILREPTRKEKQERAQEGETPLRNADNRIPFNFHGLLVDQKASYLFTAPPLFDLGSKPANKRLTTFLGDQFAKSCKDLCIDASNSSVGWLHLWKSDRGSYEYAVVPPEQIVPIWSHSLNKRLLGVLRTYVELAEETGDSYVIYEYWTDEVCCAYRLRAGDEIGQLVPYQVFMADPQLGEKSAEYDHGIGEVPFFPFFNNNTGTDDLKNIKGLIDTYCKVFSGFVNDLEDIQEIIFVLTNYGGADLNEFLSDLKYYKAIKVENDGDGDKSGVSTLTIDLPVEAREKLLAITRKCIFEQGRGIDPDPENFGNSSGVALQFLYALLELKAGLLETEFKLGFGRFIRCVCRLLGIRIREDTIVQTWTRTSVKNDLELSQIAQQSAGVVSDETIVEHHPWVEDAAKELERLQKQEEKAQERMADYQDAFQKKGKGGEGGDPVNGEE